VNPQIWWFLSRASGIVAWFLLTAAVLMVFLGIHLGGLLLDSYIEFGLKDFLIPMATDWKPVPVALGVVAMWLLIIVQLSSLIMKRLPRRLWKWVHITSYQRSSSPAFAGRSRARMPAMRCIS
jgi:predicted ferric reductase